MSKNPTRALENEEWFHEDLAREGAESLLVNEGDYLVRQRTHNEERQIVLSVRWNGHKHFIFKQTPEHRFHLGGSVFFTIQELIDYHHRLKLPVCVGSEAILCNPIFRDRWELNPDDVKCIEEIGRGNFGVVSRAILHPKKVSVAVKTCRVTLPEEQRNFLREARILKQYNHRNVVRLVGICVHKQPIMIVMEYIRRGSLLDYLRRHHETLSTRHLFRMSRDCAAGMAYLESRRCIHRDLAARNCLVDEHYVKISDFGLSREGDRYYLTQGLNQIPFKWTAPEALHYGRYTSKCDVWSFGVLVWEIFSLGRIPYPALTNTEVLNEIDQGYRLPAPDRIPSDLYELTLMCWEKDPELRPDFDRIHKLF